MVCGSCVEKLARKLLEHHPKLDLIRAYELAEKAIVRVEVKEPEINIEASKKWGRVILKGYNPNYTQPCTIGGVGVCYFDGEACDVLSNNCTCSCPAALPNSHKVSDCSGVPTVKCTFHHPYGCTPSCTCPSGTCGYDCDTGYVWNGVSCVVPSAGLGDGLVWSG